MQRGRRLAEDLFAGRSIARRLDEYVGEGRRWVDEAADAARLQRRLDDYVSPDGAVARLGNEMVENQRLARRLDEYVARSGDDTARYMDEIGDTRKLSASSNQADGATGSPNITPAPEDEIYEAVAHTEAGAYILRLADEQGARPKIVFNESLEVTQISDPVGEVGQRAALDEVYYREKQEDGDVAS